MKSDEDRCDPLPRTGQNSCSTNCPDGQPGERRRRWDMRRRRTLGRLIGMHKSRGSKPELNEYRSIDVPLDPVTMQQINDNANERCVKWHKKQGKDWGGPNDPPIDPSIIKKCLAKRRWACLEISAGNNTSLNATTTFAGSIRVKGDKP